MSKASFISGFMSVLRGMGSYDWNIEKTASKDGFRGPLRKQNRKPAKLPEWMVNGRFDIPFLTRAGEPYDNPKGRLPDGSVPYIVVTGAGDGKGSLLSDNDRTRIPILERDARGAPIRFYRFSDFPDEFAKLVKDNPHIKKYNGIGMSYGGTTLLDEAARQFKSNGVKFDNMALFDPVGTERGQGLWSFLPGVGNRHISKKPEFADNFLVYEAEDPWVGDDLDVTTANLIARIGGRVRVSNPDLTPNHDKFTSEIRNFYQEPPQKVSHNNGYAFAHTVIDAISRPTLYPWFHKAVNSAAAGKTHGNDNGRVKPYVHTATKDT